MNKNQKHNDSVVNTATSYGLGCPGIKSGGGSVRDFLCPSRPVPAVRPASCTMGTRPFPGEGGGGVKQPARCADHLPPSNAEGANGLELYLCCTPPRAAIGMSMGSRYLY